MKTKLGLLLLMLLIAVGCDDSTQSEQAAEPVTADPPNIQTPEPEVGFGPEPEPEISAEEQFNLGDKYRKGEGVTHDYKEATKWFRLAAEQGHVGAQHTLDCMYEGYQTVQDYKRL